MADPPVLNLSMLWRCFQTLLDQATCWLHVLLIQENISAAADLHLPNFNIDILIFWRRSTTLYGRYGAVLRVLVTMIRNVVISFR